MKIGDEFKDEAGNTLRVVKVKDPCFKIGDIITNKHGDRALLIFETYHSKYTLVWLGTARGYTTSTREYRSSTLAELSNTLICDGFQEESTNETW